MCMFRIKHNGAYICGKRYPLECSPSVCPYGQLYNMLVKTDFKSEMVWIMPGKHLVSIDEAIEALRNGEAEYVVKSFSIGVVKHAEKRKHR